MQYLRRLHPKMGVRKLQYVLSIFHDIDIGRDKLFKLHRHLKRYGISRLLQLDEKKIKAISSEFLRNFIETIPCKIHTILTDKGVQFTNRKQDKHAFRHIFDRVCAEHNIDHRLTKLAYPWTNGQVERMNQATVKRYNYESHEKLREHLYNFVNAYNFAKRTSYECIINIWKNELERFNVNPIYHTLGLNN